MFDVENRRYVGNKFKLMDWIKTEIENNCQNCQSLFDVFAGTGAVTKKMWQQYNTFIVNDILYSNEIIYRGFWGYGNYSKDKLEKIRYEYKLLSDVQEMNYVSDMFGGKFYSLLDAKKIGVIRQDIEDKFESKKINQKEYFILLSSLLFSMDRVANTVGHYDAYIKGKSLRNEFSFDLIQPYDITNKSISIYREDSNALVKRISADIAFVDPPYNSRQYCRFYHVLENIAKWEKPELFGVAMKPKAENMSEYCRNNAPGVFDDLIQNLDVKYIVVTYNNTYTSKSSSSKNKISLEQITESVEKRGETKIFEKPYKFFNAGKTDFTNHKEYLFITAVK